MTGNTDKLLRAFIEASGFDIEEVVETNTFIQKGESGGLFSMGSPDVSFTTTTIDYKVTKKAEHYEFTKPMIENIIGVLEGHDNDGVHILINNLEVMINENI